MRNMLHKFYISFGHFIDFINNNVGYIVFKNEIYKNSIITNRDFGDRK